MRRGKPTLAWLGLALALGPGCKDAPQAPSHKIEVRKVSGDQIELVPLAGAPPNCLVFTISASGVVRQLTMNAEETSVDCEAGKRIGNDSFRIPSREGKVRIFAVFSDQKLAAPALAEQVNELGGKPGFTGLDLRAPGRVVTDLVEFVPEPSR
jgi:hypothetical protein